MRNIVKRLCICILIILISAMSGCSSNEGFNVKGQNSAIEKMLEYMNSKYDDTFTFNAPFGGSLGATSYQITVKSEKYPDCEIWVQYYEKDGKETFADNYIDYKFKEQTYDRLVSINREIFNTEVIVNYSIPSRGNSVSYDGEIAFEEYIKGKEHPISFTAVVSPEFLTDDKDRTVSYLEKCFKEYDMNIIATYRFSKSEDNFKELKENSSAKIENFERLIITIKDEGVTTCTWR